MSVSAIAAGTVYLVGAGPGDPELITVRGLRCLEAADVVVYDRLIHPDLLDAAPAAAERIFVGKAAGMHVASQRDIEALLIDRAKLGLAVVRLKGGDPFVFGRGGEEAAALAAAGVPWEVVPAVSSAIGVPARAGIPVTHRRLAASFAVLTAHRTGDLEPDGGVDWPALATIDTLVVLMGVAALPRVAAALLAAGRDPQTPVAVIERGTLADERVTTAPLDEIAATAAARGVRAPATIVVGAVVDLRATLAQAAAPDPATTATATARSWRAWRPDPTVSTGAPSHV